MMQQLQNIPATEIKIDRSFVMNLNHKSDRVMVLKTIEMGHELGLKVIAEGVETADELRVLVDLGVEWAQGYYLGRPGPLPMGAMIEPLRSWGSLL